jgi:hypothetical protein
MSHFRYIVDFKSSYSNCKYKSFVLNVIKSIKSIGGYNVLFWAIFRYSLQSSLVFKETRRIFITIGAREYWDYYFAFNLSSEERELVEQLFGFFLGHMTMLSCLSFILRFFIMFSFWGTRISVLSNLWWFFFFSQNDKVCIAIAIVYAATSKIKTWQTG